MLDSANATIADLKSSLTEFRKRTVQAESMLEQAKVQLGETDPQELDSLRYESLTMTTLRLT